MVFYPKPGIIKEYGCELLACVIFYYVPSIVVAHTGGSLAFTINAALVGMSVGFLLLAFLSAWPYVHLFPQITLGMATNDLICWWRGKESGFYVLRNLGHLLIQIIAGFVAALLSWITASRSGPIFLGLPQVAISDWGEALGFMIIITAIFQIIWFWASEMATPVFSFGIRSLKADKQGDRTAQKNTHPGEGQIAIVLASLFRGFVIGLAAVVLTIAAQVVVGWSFNPALFLGYAVVSNRWADPDWWIHLFFPFVGGLLGYGIYLLLTIANTWRPLTKYYLRSKLRRSNK